MSLGDISVIQKSHFSQKQLHAIYYAMKIEFGPKRTKELNALNESHESRIQTEVLKLWLCLMLTAPMAPPATHML